MPKTCVLVLLDGLGDRAHPELDHKTPLQAADTPCLDMLAAQGGLGLYHAAKMGQPLPSENAHFAMFGSPKSEFPGRGPLEALGEGVPLADDDVAVLARFTSVMETVDSQLILKYDRICGTPDEIDALYQSVAHYEQDGVTLNLHRTGGLFNVLTMRGPVSPYVTDSNPMVDGRFLSAVRPLNSHLDDAAALRTATVLTDYLRWAYRRLSEVEHNKLRVQQKLPTINCLVTQRAGRLRERVSMRYRYGLDGLSIASGSMYAGLAQYLEMDFHRVTNSRDAGKDLAERLELAAENTERYNFIHVHTKAPDKAAHTKSPKAKVRAIEALDAGLQHAVEPLLHDKDVLLVVTADHSTPSGGSLIHSGEPVPCLFVGEGVRRDPIDRFDEISAAGGSLGCLRGDEMMHMILNYLDRARLGGIRDAPHGQEFWPGDYDPFTVG